MAPSHVNSFLGSDMSQLYFVTFFVIIIALFGVPDCLGVPEQ